MKLFTIFMPNIAAELIEQGFKLIRTEPSYKNPNVLVYIFENTVEFQLAFRRAQKNARKNKK